MTNVPALLQHVANFLKDLLDFFKDVFEALGVEF